jgi:transcriptional regulator with XRE-family HTH domain
MEDYQIERLRRRLAAAGGRGSRGYGTELRAEVLRTAQRWAAGGGAQRALAEKLGLSRATLARWISSGDVEAAPKLRAVDVVDDGEDVAAEIVAVLPRGVRIEGLTMEDVADLARRLG